MSKIVAGEPVRGAPVRWSTGCSGRVWFVAPASLAVSPGAHWGADPLTPPPAQLGRTPGVSRHARAGDRRRRQRDTAARRRLDTAARGREHDPQCLSQLDLGLLSSQPAGFFRGYWGRPCHAS